MRYVIAFLVLTAFGFAQVEEQMEVVLRDVRIHVYDKEGNPVKGLKPSDFVIKENRRTMEISYFEEVDLNLPATGGEKPAGESTFAVSHRKEPRYVVMVMETAFMNKETFANSKQAIEDFIATMGEDTFVKIVQIDNGMRHLTGFTKDRVELALGLRRLELSGKLRERLRLIEKDIVDDVVEYLRDEVVWKRGMKAARADGRVLEKQRIKAAYFRSFYLNMTALAHSLRPITGSKSMLLLSGGGFVDFSTESVNTMELGKKLGRLMNQANTTIYAHVYRPKVSLSDEVLQSGRFPMEGDSKFHMNTLKNRSSFSELTGEGGSVLVGNSLNTILENESHLESSPSLMVEETGGVYSSGTNLASAKKGISDLWYKSGIYYRIGYTRFSSDMKKLNKLKIKLKDASKKDYKVVYGEVYEAPVDYLELDEDDRKVEFEAMLLFSESYRNDLNCEWGHRLFDRSGGGYRIPVLVKMPVDKFPKKGFEVGFAALGHSFELLDITKSEISQGKSNQPVFLYDVLLTDSLPKSLRYSIRNLSTGELSFHDLEFDFAAVDRREKHISPIAFSVADDITLLPLNHFRKTEDTFELSRKDDDPLRLKSTLFRPTLENGFAPTNRFDFFFQLFEIPNPAENYQMELSVFKDDQPITAKIGLTDAYSPTPGIHHYSGRIRGNFKEPGDYRLELKVVNPNDQATYTRTQSFTITK